MLELEDVRVARAGRPVLDGASLRLEHGLAALVGRNGCGKTTLLRVAAGLLRPQSGAARLDGRAPEPRRAGYLPQRAHDAFLAPTLLEEATRTLGERAGGQLAAFGLAHLAPRHPLALSGGERRRAALALALAGDRTLLLDEPTSGLDAAGGGLLRAAIRGRTALVATHDPDLALAADRVLVLDAGRVHDAGAPPAFLRSAWPARLGWEVA